MRNRSRVSSGACRTRDDAGFTPLARHLSFAFIFLTFVISTADNDVGECRGTHEGVELARPLLAVDGRHCGVGVQPAPVV
jgi:hypothetical protein